MPDEHGPAAEPTPEPTPTLEVLDEGHPDYVPDDGDADEAAPGGPDRPLLALGTQGIAGQIYNHDHGPQYRFRADEAGQYDFRLSGPGGTPLQVEIAREDEPAFGIAPTYLGGLRDLPTTTFTLEPGMYLVAVGAALNRQRTVNARFRLAVLKIG